MENYGIVRSWLFPQWRTWITGGALSVDEGG